MARQYAGFSHFDRNINKLDIKNKKEHFVKINDQYLFIDNEINQIQKFDKNLTLIEKNSLPEKIINSSMYEDFIIFSLADGSILKNKVPDLSLIKKRKLFDDDFITVLSVIDKKIYFGTFQGKFGNVSFDLNENVNILDKSILSINNIIKYENKIFFSSIDGTIKEVKKNGKINIFQITEKDH